MQVGILLYKKNVIGVIRFQSNYYDVMYDTPGFPRTEGELWSYLCFPRPDVVASRSFFHDFVYYYDRRLPSEIHRNHEKPLRGRILNRYYERIDNVEYTCYTLNDGSVAYTKNYRLFNNFYYLHGYDEWTLGDSLRFRKKLLSTDNEVWLSYVTMNFIAIVISDIIHALYWFIPLFISSSLFVGAIFYLVSEFEIVKRLPTS